MTTLEFLGDDWYCRTRLPVAAKMALATVGAIGGTALLPNPPGGRSEATM